MVASPEGAVEAQLLSLAEAFAQAHKLVREHNTSGSADAAEQALSLLRLCEQHIRRLALFSANEDRDDLRTTDIKYLLVPALKAEVLASSRAADASARATQVREAAEAIDSFLSRGAQYDVLGAEASVAYRCIEEGQQLDACAQRTAKIERARRMKALAAMQAHLESQKGRQAAVAEQDGTEQGALVGGASGWDEDDERQLWLLQVERAALDALDSRRLLDQEAQLLACAAQRPGADGSSGPGTSGRDEDAAVRSAMREKLLGIAGQLGSLELRAKSRAEVFRPSHILPTLTVEQQGAIELAQARDREAAERRRTEAARLQAEERRGRGGGDEEEDEEELAKARAWDDWKDHHRRGEGNSKLTPCG